MGTHGPRFVAVFFSDADISDSARFASYCKVLIARCWHRSDRSSSYR